MAKKMVGERKGYIGIFKQMLQVHSRGTVCATHFKKQKKNFVLFLEFFIMPAKGVAMSARTVRTKALAGGGY